MEEYTTKGQGYFDNMMQTIDGKTERPTYASFNDRYRLRSEPRSPLDPDPDDLKNPDGELPAVLYIELITTPP
jgi:hypothetical protein